MKKALAQVCRVCPACILRRKFPDSSYGRLMRRIERTCPFCRYDALRPDGRNSQEAEP